jgi:hypothetical protein
MAGICGSATQPLGYEHLQIEHVNSVEVDSRQLREAPHTEPDQKGPTREAVERASAGVRLRRVSPRAGRNRRRRTAASASCEC